MLKTMKAVFSCWGKRIAPVFDTAQQVHIVEVESGRIVFERQELLAQCLPMQKTLRLSELGASVLICGAISRPLQVMVAAYGIQLIPFVTGDLTDVIQAWLKGGLNESAFAMPGCYRRVRRHCRSHDNIYQEEKIMNGRGQGGKGAGGGRGQGGMGGGQGKGRGGQGRSRMGGPLGAGASGTCLCPKCGHRVAHERGVPCVQRQCPKCGTVLTRE